MTPTPSRVNVERFRALVGRRLGLYFDDGKLEFLTDILHQRLVNDKAKDIDAYLRRLSTVIDSRTELRALAEQLTVGETYFFRHHDSMRAFAEAVLPDRLRVQGPRRRLRILSAGCASGEEAYSLAILVRDHVPTLSGWDVSISGIDINPAIIEKARLARYSAWALRETAADVRDRHFRSAGRDFVLDERIRRMASFEERNLMDDDAGFWQKSAFDIVFCRNVTMYFSVEVSRAVVARIAESLAPGGYLFLGHAETLRGVSNDFHLRHTHEAFYYQRRESSEIEVSPVWAPSAGASIDPLPALAAVHELDGSWVDAIRGASDRIAHLAHDSRRTAAGVEPTKTTTPALRSNGHWDIGLALELLREERFTDALDFLQALPQESHTDPDAQLLRAVLFTNSGNMVAADATCRQLLSRDELNVGAHYLTALSREHAGDPADAIEHDQTAAYLDPAFAMPHLHMGLLARRAGEMERAQQELERALILLVREDASRILLFGGGFTREALMHLCRAELRTAGGKP